MNLSDDVSTSGGGGGGGGGESGITTASLCATKRQRKQLPSCPCCVFLKQDLFLPSSIMTVASSSGTAAALKEQSLLLNNKEEVVPPLEALACIAEYALHIQQQQKLEQPQENQRNDNNDKLPILLVDTHNHAHLRRERHAAYLVEPVKSEPSYQDTTANNAGVQLPLVSLTLAVDPNDWDDALAYSASENYQEAITGIQKQEADTTLMGLGVHPWYLANETDTDTDDTIIEPNGPWQDRLEYLLEQHPSAIVGEIGLCKMAKCARSHPEGKQRGFYIQRLVLQAQLNLATKHRRPVSIHCVQQHGVLLEMLQEKLPINRGGGKVAKALTTQGEASNNDGTNNNMMDPTLLMPPAMAMHSFTGTAHHVKTLLQWEATLFGEGPNDSKRKKKRRQKQQQEIREETVGEASSQPVDSQPTIPPPRRPLLYFGFSHIINHDMCTSEKARRQGREAVRAVPLDRLLAESDVHHPLDVPAGTAGAIAYMAWALERPIPEVAEITAKNGLTFLQSHLLTVT